MPVFVAVGLALGASAGTAAIVGGVALGAAAIGTAVTVSGMKSQAKAAKTANSIMAGTQGITGTANPETTVDPTANNQNQINQLGRAALISTSPQGVQGTDQVGRYRLLGN